jgi:hypothetical protein
LKCRSAYHESVQLGQELVKKIQNTTDDNSNSKDNGYDNDESDSDNEINTNKKVSSHTAQQLKKYMESISDINQGKEKFIDTKNKYNKLFDMSFMKKAAEKQVERSQLEAQQVLRELQQMEAEMENSDEEDIYDDALSPHEKMLKQQYEFHKHEELENKKREAEDIVSGLLPISVNLASKSSSQSGMTIKKKRNSVSVKNTSLMTNEMENMNRIDSGERQHNPWLNTKYFNTNPSSTPNTQRKSIKDNEIYVQVSSLINKNSQVVNISEENKDAKLDHMNNRTSVLQENKVNRGNSKKLNNQGPDDESAKQHTLSTVTKNISKINPKPKEVKPLLLQTSQVYKHHFIAIKFIFLLFYCRPIS